MLPMKNLQLFLTWLIGGLLLISSGNIAWAQSDSTSTEAEPNSLEGVTFTPADDAPQRSRVDPPQNFGLIFGRSFLLAGGLPDSVPVSGGASGAYFLGAGYRFYVDKSYRFGFRFTPGIAWNRYTYEQTTAKTFPTIRDSSQTISQERHTVIEGKLEVSIFVNLTRDEDSDPKLFIEAGGYGSYITAMNYVRRFDNSDNLRVREKYRDLEKLSTSTGNGNSTNTVNRLQYGLFGRLGFKWAGLYVGYRLSDVLNATLNDALLFREASNYQAPNLPPLDVGLHILF